MEVDCGFHAVLATLPDYELTVGSRTWNSVLRYAEDLKKRKVKVAFFSATPQGGGVALMRHALVRFAEALGVDFKWSVYIYISIYILCICISSWIADPMAHFS